VVLNKRQASCFYSARLRGRNLAGVSQMGALAIIAGDGRGAAFMVEKNRRASRRGGLHAASRNSRGDEADSNGAC